MYITTTQIRTGIMYIKLQLNISHIKISIGKNKRYKNDAVQTDKKKYILPADMTNIYKA